jgi:formylglycine-generating enzyme required for sulfatase activity
MPWYVLSFEFGPCNLRIPACRDWPVEVNYHEARAFLNWKAAAEGIPASRYRMPTGEVQHAFHDVTKSCYH